MPTVLVPLSYPSTDRGQNSFFREEGAPDIHLPGGGPTNEELAYGAYSSRGERIEFKWIDHKDLCDLKLRPISGSSERPDSTVSLDRKFLDLAKLIALVD